MFIRFIFGHSIVSSSLRPHGLQHARLLCPSPSPGACSNSGPLSQWHHPTISFCHPHLLLPSVFTSIRVFSNESALHIRWLKYWSFNFSINPSNEYSGLISFKIDWFDLLAVQGTLKESSPAPQFESISSSALSLLYGPTFTSIHDYGENHSLTVWTLLAKWCLCFLTHSVGLSQLIFQGASHMVLSNYESGLFCHFSSPYWLSGAQTLVQTIYDGQCHLETWYLINISWVNGWMDGKLDEVLSSQDSWLFPGPPSPLL